MAEPRSTYTREEMEAIFNRAIERQQATAEGTRHDELVEARREDARSGAWIGARARPIAPGGAPSAGSPGRKR